MIPYRVLVCGSRHWRDSEAIHHTLDLHLRLHYGRIEIIHGNARGADLIADSVARGLGLVVHPYPADWNAHGRAAGPIRNRQMLDQHPDVVLAFKDGFDHTFSRGGTEHMVKIALDAQVPCLLHDHDHHGRLWTVTLQ